MYLVFPVAIWFLFFALYLFLAGTVDTVEMTAGFVCAGAGTALAIGLRRVAHRRLAFGPPPARAILRPIAALIPETLSVGRQLVAAIFAGTDQRGAFVRQSFDPGADDRRSTGRRAIAVIGGSLAPGSFVIRGDRSETMILHALPSKPPSPDPRWLT